MPRRIEEIKDSVAAGAKEIDIVIISTPHNQLTKILLEAYRKNKHILVEKPAAKNLDEIKKIISKVKGNKIKIRIGYIIDIIHL